MACFLVSAAEALITTAVTKVVEKNEKKQNDLKISFDGEKVESASRIPFSRKLKWLNRMLWGGSALLMFEHIWHGEVVPFFPFLTAASNAEDASEMLHEMATVGVSMAVLITAVWFVMCKVADALVKKPVVEPEKTIA